MTRGLLFSSLTALTFSIFGWLLSCSNFGFISNAESVPAVEPLTLICRRPQGEYRYSWRPPRAQSKYSVGTATVTFTRANGEKTVSSVEFFINTVSDDERFASWRKTAANEFVLQFGGGAQPFEVAAKFRLSGEQLLCSYQSDQPVITDLGAHRLVREKTVRLNVPYYTGEIAYVPRTGSFTTGYFDWTLSSATRQEDGRAVYGALTDQRRNPLRELYVIAIEPSLSATFPAISEASPSHYRQQLAGATVLDIWNQQRFDQISRALNRLRKYGKQDCVVLVHNWQKDGYDNGLPTQYPANAAQGGDAALGRAISAAHELGCLAGLHQNYVDYYPNTEHFTKDAIARNSDGSLMKAWFNASTKIQSFATRPTWFLRNAAPEASAIHSRYGTDASFLDVNSAVFPWFRADMAAGQPGAGEFVTAAHANKDLWALQRTVNNGPVFGEGLNHWFWSGLLDGVEAQFGAGVKAAGEDTPLMVDFDLLRIHPLQVNHGVGMYDRWTRSGKAALSARERDAYRMQELIYGHAPYLGGDDWETPWQVLAEENLLGPVAARYGKQTVEAIEYDARGKWVDGSAAAAAGDWSRVSVSYANGDQIIANGRSEVLRYEGLTLPQYGWLAKGNGLLAYTALLAGSFGDYAQTADLLFANARNQLDRDQSGAIAEPTVSLEQYQPGRVLLRIHWRALATYAGPPLTTFVHFVNANTGRIAFQADHASAIPVSTWQAGDSVKGAPFEVRIPSSAPDGRYSMRLGLYQPAEDERIRLYGNDDGTERYEVATLVLSHGGKEVAFVPAPAFAASPEERMTQKMRLVDFQTVRTDGMVMLKKKDGRWLLQTYPDFRTVTVQLNARDFPLPASIDCEGRPAPIPRLQDGYWTVPSVGGRRYTWRVQPQ